MDGRSPIFRPAARRWSVRLKEGPVTLIWASKVGHATLRVSHVQIQRGQDRSPCVYPSVAVGCWTPGCVPIPLSSVGREHSNRCHTHAVCLRRVPRTVSSAKGWRREWPDTRPNVRQRERCPHAVLSDGMSSYCTRGLTNRSSSIGIPALCLPRIAQVQCFA